MVRNEVRVSRDDLRDFASAVFVQLGLPSEDAAAAAEVLVWANLRGVDSHGVMQLPNYVRGVENRVINPTPRVRVLKQTPATLFLDADRALGPSVTAMAMRQVMAKAKQVGIGWGLISNTGHQGALGYYPLLAAAEDMAGIALACGSRNMAPHGARAAGVDTSPIAIAVPAAHRDPLLLDMATSVAAAARIQLAEDKGTSIPEGWALDKGGEATTDPAMAAVMMPFGGAKGSGLSLMFECLTSLMAGNPILESSLPAEQRVPRGIQNGVVAAIDISAFTDLDSY